ncbi:outer membrane beta-barrel protein [Bacteroides mediterraneensis]|nr:outer membrane beta-barrel protein [Bacteroides mediterraneensis]
MKNEEKWINNLRSQMEDYSEPLPDGLWDKLETELEEQNKPKVIPLWRRWQAAAAVLILLVSSLTYWFWSSPEADFQNQQLAVEVKDTPLPENRPIQDQVTAEVAMPGKSEPEMKLTASTDVVLEQAVRKVSVEEEKTDEVIVGEPEKEESKTIKNETLTETADTQVQQKKRLRASREADRERMKQNAEEAKSKSTRSSGFSLGVGAGNTPYGSLSTFDGMGSFVARSAYYVSSDLNMAPVNNGGLAYSQILLENAAQSPQTSVKHHMPVTIGFSLDWNLDKNWTLETGLNYTLLSSDIRSGSKSYVEETQKLHYVGIPLKIRRSIWQNRWFSVYASVGGAVEKCVSGRLESVTVTNGGNRTSERTSLEVDPLQWSVAAAAGAQVNFTSRLGLYLEPGVAYYFDDHSGVETIRKEHPFNFNLQLGLRFHVIK